MSTPLIPVFYSPKQAVPGMTHFSPSAGKPAIVAEALVARRFPVRVVGPRPLLFAELTRAHDAHWVERILSGQAQNGFGNADLRVARSLPYTSGSMLSAALAATPTMPAVSLSSGFHHAGWSRASGFCTLNGLAITALALLAQGKARRVAILDCDAHYGDGTDEILRHVSSSVSSKGGFQVPGGQILHRTVGKTGARHGGYIDKVREFLVEIADFHPDVVLYQAGADPHECDPLGGYISTEEMRARDRMVFELCKDFALPVAWNLAGGYHRGGSTGIDPVLALHLNTFREACRVYGLPIPEEMVVRELSRPNQSRWGSEEAWPEVTRKNKRPRRQQVERRGLWGQRLED
jgi:acetoin utilization deacetylase AcuC-like enzyme